MTGGVAWGLVAVAAVLALVTAGTVLRVTAEPCADVVGCVQFEVRW